MNGVSPTRVHLPWLRDIHVEECLEGKGWKVEGDNAPMSPLIDASAPRFGGVEATNVVEAGTTTRECTVGRHRFSNAGVIDE